MKPAKSISIDDLDLKKLEFSLDELIQVCGRLVEENAYLRSQQARLKTEHSRLLDKNELAQSRMEAIIRRLKSMEYET